MTELAWMKVYIGTETALTGHLTAEEFGAYERLRRHYWQHRSLPEDEARQMRIAGIDPDRWPAIASAIVPLLADGLPRLDQERVVATDKREKKVAAGLKGASVRWGQNGNTIGHANSKPDSKSMANAMAEPMDNQWPSASASASDEERYEERLAPTRTRDPIPRFTDRLAAGRWITDRADLFPGDPGFDGTVSKLIAGTLTWADIDRSAA